uniref:RNase H type-1 domain-containing protein n=1 Tax=Arion vulgaris TaxID=1028688 RepID=A0A0B7BQ11_9EUPU
MITYFVINTNNTHSGVQGNDRADFLANNAPTQAGRSMDRADVINVVRSQLCDMGEYQTLDRL